VSLEICAKGQDVKIRGLQKMEEKKKEEEGEQKRKSNSLVYGLIGLVAVLLLALLFLVTPLKGVISSKSAPEISLAVIGMPEPKVVEDTGSYRFEVEARVLGNPEPQVAFSRNDEISTTAKNRTVVILSGGESFTLVATASNTIGSTSAELQLSTVGSPSGKTPDSQPPEGGTASPPPNPPAGGGTASPPPNTPSGGGTAPPPPAPPPGGEATPPPPDEDETPDPPSNSPPAITGLTISNDLLFTFGEYIVTVSAFDPDGDNLSYTWTVTGGSIVNTNDSQMTWKAPGTAGDYLLTVTIQDGRDGQAELTTTASVKKVLSTSLQSPLLPALIPTMSAFFIPVSSESGHIAKNDKVYTSHYVGDTKDKNFCRGFFSFNISELTGAKVKSVELQFQDAQILGLPTVFNGLWVGVVDYGSRSLVVSDYSLPATNILKSTDFNFTLKSVMGESDDLLARELQNKITQGNERFQIRLNFDIEKSDLDRYTTGVLYGPWTPVTLKVTYTK
jgi:hypothetical protein